MKRFILTDSDKNIGIVRNPFERVISLYKASWGYSTLAQWLDSNEITPQCELYKDCDAVITLESWKTDSEALGITPDKDILTKLESMYSSDYKRWYGEELKKRIEAIAQSDLDTYGYRF